MTALDHIAEARRRSEEEAANVALLADSPWERMLFESEVDGAFEAICAPVDEDAPTKRWPS